MQAIRTRYVGPSNVKGSAIIARCEAGSIRMSYRHELNIDDNHAAACMELRKKLKWTAAEGMVKVMHGGSFAGDMYWVFPVEWATVTV